MSTQGGQIPEKSHRGDYAILIGIVVIFLVPWALLWAAALVAGGSPSYGPVAAWTPSNLIANYNKDHGIVWWHLVGAFNSNIHPWLFYGSLVLILLLLGAGIAFGTFYWKGGFPAFGPPMGKKNLEKGTHWANLRDLKRLRVKEPVAGRYILGTFRNHLIATEKEQSVLVIGPTRSGKTSSLIVPDLFDWDGPVVVTSTKEELVVITGAARQQRGPVFIYDPTGERGDPRGREGGYKTCTFSPLSQCWEYDKLDKTRKLPSWNACWKNASHLCAGLNKGGKGDTDWAYWAESSKRLIAPLFYAAIITGRTMMEVTEWVNKEDAETPIGLIEAAAQEAGLTKNASGNWIAPRGTSGDLKAADVQIALESLVSIDKRPEKERGTVYSTSQSLFGVFMEPAVRESVQTSNFDPEELLLNKGTLYLITPSEKKDRVAGLFVSILESIIGKAFVLADDSPKGRLEPELGLFLDELANVCPIEELDSYASQGAGRGVLLLTIVQDISQLKQRYGDNRVGTILNNHGAKLILRGISDPESAKYICDVIGQGYEKDTSKSFTAGQAGSQSESMRLQPLVTPDVLRRLQVGRAILIYRDAPPVMLNLRPWYEDKHFQSLSKLYFSKTVTHFEYLPDTPAAATD